MTGNGSTGETNGSSKSHQVRQKAQALRQKQRKKDLRNRILLQGGIGVLVIAAIIAVVVIVVSSIKPETGSPKNMASDGIVIGKELKAQTTPALAAGAPPVATTTDPSVVHIRLYVDYLCPWCGQFEKTNMEQIERWLNKESAVLEVHPIAVLTSKSQGTEYSLRAANAAACVANSSPDAFFAYNELLFSNQPEEGSAGLTDDKLISLAKKAGASSITDCVTERTYDKWVQAATQRAVNGPISGATIDRVEATPTILVNGKQYTGALDDVAEFKAFVIQTNSEPVATTTPSPSPSAEDGEESEK